MKFLNKKNLSLLAGGLVAIGAISSAWAQQAVPPMQLTPAPEAAMPAQPAAPAVAPVAMSAPTVAPAAPVLAPPADEAPAPVKKGKKSAAAKMAPVAPLPESYLVVKKEHEANEFESRLGAARAALAQGQNGAALELFNNLYTQYPKDTRVVLGRAVSMQRIGRNDEALASYEEALTTDPRNLEALTNMLGILNMQDRSTALDKLKQLSEVYPFNADIAAQLGMIYGQTGDYPNAVKYLNVADNLKPGSVAVLYNRAIAYDKMGQTADAASLYRKLIQLDGDGLLDPSYPVDAIKKRLAVLN